MSPAVLLFKAAALTNFPNKIDLPQTNLLTKCPNLQQKEITKPNLI